MAATKIHVQHYEIHKPLATINMHAPLYKVMCSKEKEGKFPYYKVAAVLSLGHRPRACCSAGYHNRRVHYKEYIHMPS